MPRKQIIKDYSAAKVLFAKRIGNTAYDFDANTASFRIPNVEDGKYKELWVTLEGKLYDRLVDEAKKRYIEKQKLKENKDNKDVKQREVKEREVKEREVKEKKEEKFVEKEINKKLFEGELLFKQFMVRRVEIIRPYVSYLAEETYNIYSDVIKNINIPGGFNVKLKLIACSEKDGKPGKFFSWVVRSDNVITKNDIIKLYNIPASQTFETQNYFVYTYSIEIIISNLSDKGGCSDHKGKYKSSREKFGDDSIILKSYKSKNNNCLLQCYNIAYDVKGNEIKPDSVRKALNIPSNEKIGLDKIPMITEYYNTKLNKNKGFQVLNEKFEIVSYKYFDNSEDYIKLFLRDEHYFLFDVIEFKKCDKCGRKLRLENENHKCNINRASYRRRQIHKKRDFVQVHDVKEASKIDYNDIVHWDLETFQHIINHVPYASGWFNKEYKTSYGFGCIDKTIDEFITYENKIISAYNGAGFDFYFLLDKLTERNINISNVILANGRLMSFTYGNNNKVFDLCLFLTSSLDSACKDFKTKNRKTFFDHNKIKSWVDVESHRKDVEPYLNCDVAALKELFEMFNDMIYKLFSANITKYLSAGHMAYSLWTSTLKSFIEVPQDLEKYTFITKGTFGARCYPQKKIFSSKKFNKLRIKYDSISKDEISMYNKFINNKQTDIKIAKMIIINKNIDIDDFNSVHEQKKKLLFDIKSKNIKKNNNIKIYNKLKLSKDFIFNADASSLYPASMKGFKLMKVKYPIGFSSWSDKPQEEYKKGKIGFYEIVFTPPTDIRIPILPTKRFDKNNNFVGIDWSLKQNTGVYTSVDIENAIDAGYKIEFINKCLVWEESGEIFNEYIETFYKIKEEAEKEKNEVKRSVAKLFLNSLYGKTLQKANFNCSQVINNVFEFNKFIREYVLNDFVILNENKMLLSGEARIKQEKITKPKQLGAFVTAYSRRVMLTYMKALDPTLKRCVFTYTDTDSLHISGEDYETLSKLGYIKEKDKAELGYLCSDIKKEGLIFYEKNLAPKTYLYEYINNEGTIKENDKATMKCKGIPNKCLKSKLYKEELKEELEFSGLKKKHKTLTKSDVEIGVKHFSIVNNTQSRTFNKSSWEGMDFINGEWFPTGFNK